MRTTILTLCLVWVCGGFTPRAAADGNASKTTPKQYVCPPCGCDKDKEVFDKPGTCPACHMPLIERSQIKIYNVAVVVHQGVELLDFAGPGEVFAAASRHNGGTGVNFNVYTVGPTAEPVVSQGFLKITPEYTIANCPEPDVLVIPGGGTRVLVDDAKFMAWAKGVTAKAKATLTVCTGAFVVARNGQLDGLEATTHFGSISGLRSSFPKMTVRENVRFVDNGKIVTTAGVSAGIDGALHVVAKLANFSAAKETARYMEYEWTAEEKTMGMLSDAQRAEAERREKRNADFKLAYETIHAQQWTEAVKAFERMTTAYPEDKESWYYLGLAHHHLEHWQEAIRANEKAATLTGYVPYRPVYNIACAYARIGQTDHALNALEQAVRLWMRDVDHIRNDSDLESLRQEPRYRALIAGLGE